MRDLYIAEIYRPGGGLSLTTDCTSLLFSFTYTQRAHRKSYRG